MRCSVEGIMYPEDAKKSLSFLLNSPAVRAGSPDPICIEVPHAAWSECRPDLDRIFSSLKGLNPSYVFVLGPLHKGPVYFERPCDVYAPSDGVLKGSDWEIALEVPKRIVPDVTVSDDICSEEQSLEIIAPYLSLLFPDAKVCHLLASAGGDVVKKIASVIGKDFPNAMVFISNNKETCCAGMWKEAFSDGNLT